MICVPIVTFASLVAFPFLPLLAEFIDREKPAHERDVTIFLVREHWHTGIIVPYDLALRCIPEVAHLPSTAWIDFGWGEADFYQTPGFDLRLALEAILHWNESVLRVAAVPQDLRRYYGQDSWLLPLCLDSARLRRLCQFLQHTLVRDSSGQAILTSSQAGGWVRFYKARGTYWGLQTCNTWVAKALASTGLRIWWQGIVVAEQLFAVVRFYRCPRGPLHTEPE
ncbi:MAG: DUF2459 domain-containing protein [Candidatus Kapabacteria bacterium]|nr:DUF2459 domain-containing protein [Candidatus Kapabacteria bacterium]MCS7169964.1 DUF2459 domain-containing protein [Candidatus Kapabacteria bacterium]MDW7996114.1 DUF2459 domain-containing protein [Bacteroidota bacterium]MDW8224469.1 DUF2459 domain-containing protein [Bacteroidota bacterium]